MLSFKKHVRHDAANIVFRVVFLIVFCALSLLVSSCSKTKEKSAAANEPRPAAPQQITQIDDAKLHQLLMPNGKPLLVNFWATWCGPCREEFPDLVEIDDEYRGKVDFITVTLDSVEEKDTGVPQFLTEMNAEMPTYLLKSADENAMIPSVSKDWTGALPFTILYHQNGDVAYTRQGKVNPATLMSEIEKTLGGN